MNISTTTPAEKTPPVILKRTDIAALISTLQTQGFQVIGPVLRDGAIDFDVIDNETDLPWGWGETQGAGTYATRKLAQPGGFQFANGPTSLKKFLHPTHRRLWHADLTDEGFEVLPDEAPIPKLAFLGIRPCDLAGIDLLDKVFSDADVNDPTYAATRKNCMFLAVNCGVAGGTCFCVSMATGPRATYGYDLALTELIDDTRHDFLVEIGSPQGENIIASLSTKTAHTDDIAMSVSITERTASSMGRILETKGLKNHLRDNPDHAAWDDVADRCLTCGNCTMVCPTCFCTTLEDRMDLDGSHAERWQHWESCFSLDFSQLSTGPVRKSAKSRYRHWLTHKLSTWVDQFGDFGCVGCGRCITWCPVGIDITAEAARIASSDKGSS